MKKKKGSLVKGAGLLALLFSVGAVMTACSSGTPSTTSQQADVKVTWSGVEDLELDMGDQTPNLLTGVTAKQGDKSLTVKIDEERSDEVDTGVAGAFSIYYVAYDGEKAIAESLNGEYIRTVNVSRDTYIDNADFTSSDKKGWSGNPNGNSAMTWEIDAAQSALVVDITKSGNEYWQNQVEFNGLSVKKDTTYVITIRAKADAPRNMGASLEVPSLGYQCIDAVSVNSVGYELKTEYADYTYYYTASDNFDGVKFGICMGRFNEKDEPANKIYIDKVSIVKADKLANSTGVVFTNKDNVTIHSYAEYLLVDPVEAHDAAGNELELIKEGAVQGVEFADELGTAVFGEMWKYVDASGNLSYHRRQISYAAPAPERVHDYDTLDGDFEYGVKFWKVEENDIVDIEANLADHTVVISSVKAAPSGEADWRGQLQQNNNGGKLEANHAYKMVVKAKIDNINVNTLRLEFCAGAGNPNAKADMIFDEADTYKTFETAPFQPSEDVTGAAYRPGLLIGEYSEAYVLTVESIHVVEVEAETPYVRETVYEVMNGDFSLGLKHWKLEENGNIAISDNSESEAGTVKIVSTKEELPTGLADWQAQLQQTNNGGKLEAGHSYKATVRAKVNNPAVRTLRLEFCAGAGNTNAKVDMIFDAADTYQTFETAVFTPTDEVSGSAYRVGLLLAEYDVSYELIVDEIAIVEVA